MRKKLEKTFTYKKEKKGQIKTPPNIYNSYVCLLAQTHLFHSALW